MFLSERCIVNYGFSTKNSGLCKIIISEIYSVATVTPGIVVDLITTTLPTPISVKALR